MTTCWINSKVFDHGLVIAQQYGTHKVAKQHSRGDCTPELATWNASVLKLVEDVVRFSEKSDDPVGMAFLPVEQWKRLANKHLGWSPSESIAVVTLFGSIFNFNSEWHIPVSKIREFTLFVWAQVFSEFLKQSLTSSGAGANLTWREMVSVDDISESQDKQIVEGESSLSKHMTGIDHQSKEAPLRLRFVKTNLATILEYMAVLCRIEDSAPNPATRSRWASTGTSSARDDARQATKLVVASLGVLIETRRGASLPDAVFADIPRRQTLSLAELEAWMDKHLAEKSPLEPKMNFDLKVLAPQHYTTSSPTMGRHSPTLRGRPGGSPKRSPVRSFLSTVDHAHNLAAARQPATNARQSDIMVIGNIISDTIVMDGSENEGVQPQRRSLHLKCCRDSYIYILQPFEFTHILGCTNSTIVLGPVKGLITVDHCERVKVIAPGGQFVLRNCFDSEFSMYTKQQTLVMGDCRGISIGPYNTFYPRLCSHLKASKFSELADGKFVREENLWRSVLVVCDDNNQSGEQRRATNGNRLMSSGSSGSSAYSEDEVALSNDMDQLMKPSRNSSIPNGTVSFLAPSAYVPFATPVRAVTPANDAGSVCDENPFPIPEEFAQALKCKFEEVRTIMELIQTPNGGPEMDESGRDPAVLKAAIQDAFRDWLLSSGNYHQLVDLMKLSNSGH